MGVRVPSTHRGPWRYLALPGTPEAGGFAGFALAHLEAGQELLLPWSGVETVVVPLRGAVSVSAGGTAIDLTGRDDVWESPTDVAYLPRGDAAATARAGGTPADVAFGLAPATQAAEARPRRVAAGEVGVEARGEGATLRHVRHLYEADRPAQRLLVVEVVTPPGHWSSFPPHRHDEPEPLEEFYYCEIRPRARLAYLHVFDDPAADGRPPRPGDTDEAVAVRHGDLVLVRRGYHTAACPPGGALYYLNVMAGADRAWSPTFHPAYRDMVVGWEKAPVTRRTESQGPR